jgi:micrococcal nuclease
MLAKLRVIGIAAAGFGLVVGLALAGAALRARFVQEGTGERHRVEQVVDGDTIVLVGGTTVRIIGLDTPETHHPDLGEQPFGREAWQRATELMAGKVVVLEPDVEPLDHYGRRLAHVWVDERLVAEVLVEEGLGRAMVIPPNERYVERIRAAEDRARGRSAGLWLVEATPIPVFQDR